MLSVLRILITPLVSSNSSHYYFCCLGGFAHCILWSYILNTLSLNDTDFDTNATWIALNILLSELLLSFVQLCVKLKENSDDFFHLLVMGYNITMLDCVIISSHYHHKLTGIDFIVIRRLLFY